MRTDDTRLRPLEPVVSHLKSRFTLHFTAVTVMGLTNDLKYERGTGDWILLGTESKHSLENEVAERRENKQTDSHERLNMANSHNNISWFGTSRSFGILRGKGSN